MGRRIVAILVPIVLLAQTLPVYSQEWNLEDEGDWYHAAIESVSEFGELSLVCDQEGREFGLAVHHPSIKALKDPIVIQIDSTLYPADVKLVAGLDGTVFLTNNQRKSGVTLETIRAIIAGRVLRLEIPSSLRSKYQTWDFPLAKAKNAVDWLAKNCGLSLK